MKYQLRAPSRCHPQLYMCDIYSFRLSSANPIKRVIPIREKWSISAFYALLNSHLYCHPCNCSTYPPPSTFWFTLQCVCAPHYSAILHLKIAIGRPVGRSVGRVRVEYEKSALVADRTATCRLPAMASARVNR